MCEYKLQQHYKVPEQYKYVLCRYDRVIVGYITYAL